MMEQVEAKQQHIDFLKANFNYEDWLCINDTVFKKTYSCNYEKAHKTMSLFIAVNPIKQGTARGQNSVAKHTGWLLEADKKYDDFDTPSKDDDGNEIPVSLEEQRRVIEESGIPFASVVYSGGKSLHIIPRVKEDLDVKIWKATWKAFAHVLWNYYNLRVDPQTCDAARWTRRPGVVRDNGKMQTLEFKGEAITFETLEKWFAKYNVLISDFVEQDKPDLYIQWDKDAVPHVVQAHEAVCKYLKFGSKPFGSESRAMSSYYYFRAMRGAGISKDEALQMALDNWRNLPSRDHESTESIIVTECNNVWNKPSVPAFAVTNIQHYDINSKGKSEPESTTPDLEIPEFDNVEPKESEPRESKERFFRNLDNYILMGNDIMRKDYDRPDKINPTKINYERIFKKKLMFTDQDFIALPEFDGWVNEPSILNFQQTIGSKWNLFSKVEHDIKKGPWPNIEKLINHVFGENEQDHDQRAEYYERLRVLVTNPKQKHQALCLTSKGQKTSKSFVAWFESQLVGENNSVKVKNSEFEDKFNSMWVNALIINMDEPYFEKKETMTKVIREMITSDAQNLRKMQTDYEGVPFYGKLIFTSNDTNFINFEKDDRRYWVRRTFPVPEQDKDVNFDKKVLNEIGHFIYYLIHELKPMYTEKADETFWLPQSVTDTESFRLVYQDSEDPLITAVREVFENYFVRQNSSDTIVFRTKDLVQAIKDNGSTPGLKIHNVTNSDVTQVVRDYFKCDNNKGKPSRLTSDEHCLDFTNPKDPQRWWRMYKSNPILKIEDVFNLKEISK